MGMVFRENVVGAGGNTLAPQRRGVKRQWWRLTLFPSPFIHQLLVLLGDGPPGEEVDDILHHRSVADLLPMCPSEVEGS